MTTRLIRSARRFVRRLIAPRRRALVLKPAGRMGNRLFQYFFCRALVDRVPGTDLFGAAVPDYGFAAPEWPGRRDDLVPFTSIWKLDVDAIAAVLAERRGPGVWIRSYVQRQDYFERAACLRWYRELAVPATVPAIGDDCLLVHVRAGDLLVKGHHHYRPLPVGRIERAVSEAGLRPVFIGELHRDSPYVAEIRRRFRGETFLEPASAPADFETIRRARNVLMSVSTFAWMAVFLSEAERIWMPRTGMFEDFPAEGDWPDLLFRDDPRVTYLPFDGPSWTASAEDLEGLLV